MSTLRDDYDPNDIPLNSSAIHRIDTSLFELSLEDDVDKDAGAANNDAALAIDSPIERTFSHKVSANVRAQRWLNRLAYQIARSRPLQAVWAMVVIASVATLYLTLTYRIEHIDDSLILMQELGELDTRVLSLEREFMSQDMQSLKESVQSADTRRVFLDYRALAVWLSEKASFAEQLGLEFSYTLGDSEASAIEGMLEVPIMMVLGSEISNEQVYLRALEFLKRVVSTPFYVELSETTLRGEGKGARELNATLRVWVHSTVKAANYAE